MITTQKWPKNILKKKIKPNKILTQAADEMINFIKSGRHDKQTNLMNVSKVSVKNLEKR